MLGRFVLWQGAVEAPGTANRQTFLPLKMSSVVLTCGPSAVITRNLLSGSLSPTWIVIVNSPWMQRKSLRPGRFLDWADDRHNIQSCSDGKRKAVSLFRHQAP